VLIKNLAVYGNLALTGTGGAESNLGGVDASTKQYSRVLYTCKVWADEAVWSYENDPGVRELKKYLTAS
jgi:hypothetical protein